VLAAEFFLGMPHQIFGAVQPAADVGADRDFVATDRLQIE
jgi:hypothetical protein